MARILFHAGVMRLSVPVCDGRISPVFDVARRLLVVDFEGRGEVSRHVESIPETDPMARTRHVVGLGVSVLICGGISRALEMMLLSTGVKVIPETCGPVEEVVRAFVSGEFTDRSFLMPGCCRRKRCRGGQRPGLRGRKNRWMQISSTVPYTWIP